MSERNIFTLETITRCDGGAAPVVDRTRQGTALRFQPGDGTSYEVLVLPKTSNDAEDSALAFVGDVYSGHDGVLYNRNRGSRKIGKPSKYDVTVLSYLCRLALGDRVYEPVAFFITRAKTQRAIADGRLKPAQDWSNLPTIARPRIDPLLDR